MSLYIIFFQIKNMNLLNIELDTDLSTDWETKSLQLGIKKYIPIQSNTINYSHSILTPCLLCKIKNIKKFHTNKTNNTIIHKFYS